MRFFSLFLITFSAFSAALWLLVGETPAPKELPDRPTEEGGPAVLVAEDLADEFGRAPFAGEVRRLDGVVVQMLDSEERFVRYYLRLGKLVRRDGRPLVDGVECAVFAPPEGDRPNLRVTIEARTVEANATEFLHAQEGAPRIVRMRGGVLVRDAEGRVLAEFERADVDLESQTITTPDEITLRLPDRDVQVRGTGLVADLGLREATLLRDVAATFAAKGKPVSLSCAGPATVTEEMKGLLLLTLKDHVRIDHSLGEARCDAVDVRLAGEGESYRLVAAALRGSVEMDLDAGALGGLERIACPAILIEGEDRAVLEGPVRAVRRGEIEWLDRGERTVDIRAGQVTLLLEGRKLHEASFEKGFSAEDRDGLGFLRADNLLRQVDGGVLAAWGDVRLESPELALEAERLRVEGEAGKDLSILLEGLRRLEAEGDRGRLGIRCGGPLRVRKRGDDLRLAAAEEVRATLDGRAISCEELSVDQRGKKLHSLVAKGSVAVVDPKREARLEGDSVEYDGGQWSLEGAPARAHMGDGRTAVAREITYHESGSFVAQGDVALLAVFRGGSWQLRCGRAEGTSRDGELLSVLATQEVTLEGPDDERFEGTSLFYDAAKGAAVLRGEPAVLSRGEELSVRSEQFELLLDGKELKEARTKGEAHIELVPKRSRGRIDRWRIEFRGPARFLGARFEVPRGARVEAFDEKDVRLLRAAVARVVVVLEQVDGKFHPTRLEGLDGVLVETDRQTVRAQSLLYRPGSNLVEVTDGGRVEAPGWPNDIVFERVVFVITEDGVELRRASQVEVGR